MAVNSRYTAAGNKSGGAKDYPKLPSMRIKAVGDKFQGTLKSVSDRIVGEDNFGGVTKKVEKEVWTYTDAVVINKTLDDDGNVTEERTEYPEANFWFEKPAQFVAIGDSLAEIGSDEPPIGKVHRFKRITDGEARQLRDGTMGSKPHRFLSEFVV